MSKKWMSMLLLICLVVCTALAPAVESRAEEDGELKIIIVENTEEDAEDDADGSFTGAYHDTNMGDSDPAYPGGTVEISEFSGQFSEPEQINDYTWSFRIESLELENDHLPGKKDAERCGRSGADGASVFSKENRTAA